MLDNDIGAPDAGSSGLRAPGTVEEFVAVPALACVLAALEEEAAQVGGRRAPSLEEFNSLLRTPLHLQAAPPAPHLPFSSGGEPAAAAAAAAAAGEDAPLRHDASAMLVDSTSMTTEQVVQRILDLVRGAQQASRA
jgi:hypothetical protein